MHGLSDMLAAGSWDEKSLWALVVLIAACMLNYQLYLAFQEFVANPISTVYSIEKQPDGIPFPSVSHFYS